jgi:hypothetical protein
LAPSLTRALKDIWSNQNKATTLAQPFVSDANGVWAFFADGLYKLVITDANDVVIFTWDNVLIQDLTTTTFAEGTAITSASTIAPGPEVWAHVTGNVTIAALTSVLPFWWGVFDGSLQLTHSGNLLCPGAVNLTVQPGDVLFFLNEGSGVWRVAGQMANSLLINRTDVSVVVQDARTNTVDAPLTVTSTTTGSPAAGIGTGMLLRAKSADETPSDFGQIQVAASDVTGASEDTYWELLCRVAGAALVPVYRFAATGAFRAIFTHANSADRIYALPNVGGTIIVHGQTDVGTGDLKTATGSATCTSSCTIGGVPDTDVAAVNMNDYSFFPSFTYDMPGASDGTTSASWEPSKQADPGNPIGRIQLHTTIVDSGPNVPTSITATLRWRYVTASDRPEIWVAYDATGTIVATWASDDPPPAGIPGVTAKGCTSLRLTSADLESWTVLSTKASEAQAYIQDKHLNRANQAYRALQLLSGDQAPAGWIAAHCLIDTGKVTVQ